MSRMYGLCKEKMDMSIAHQMSCVVGSEAKIKIVWKKKDITTVNRMLLIETSDDCNLE